VALVTVEGSAQRLPAVQEASRERSGLATVPAEMLDACRAASLLIGGPRLRRLGVTSSVREEGRTSVALAMATIQREDFGRTVVLVDLDLENPSLARKHDLQPWPGLAELARGEASLERVLQPVSEGIQLVATGAASDSASRTVAEIAGSGVLSRLGERADIVIADLPPLLGGGPGQAAARTFDDLLLVVRAGVTPAARVKEATADLHVAPSVLLNGAYSSLPTWLRRLLGR
jgi:polysaccharide biosynthesis transport protein